MECGCTRLRVHPHRHGAMNTTSMPHIQSSAAVLEPDRVIECSASVLFRRACRRRRLTDKREDWFLPLAVPGRHAADREPDNRLALVRHPPKLREQVLRGADCRSALAGEDVCLTAVP